MHSTSELVSILKSAQKYLSEMRDLSNLSIAISSETISFHAPGFDKKDHSMILRARARVMAYLAYKFPRRRIEPLIISVTPTGIDAAIYVDPLEKEDFETALRRYTLTGDL